jgi:hypothetical protein
MTHPAAAALRPMRIDGERRPGLRFARNAEHDRYPGSLPADRPADLALGYELGRGEPEAGEGSDGWTSLGEIPLVVRSLRLSHVAGRLGLPAAAGARLPRWPLVAPFGGQRAAAVREITSADPRITRLWERFSVDVGAAVERSAHVLAERIFERREAGYRALILEDGDRYAIRAMCVFTVRSSTGHVLELLHDRSVAGMRAASHLLGIVVREASGAGADAVSACSFSHSGSFPIYARHGFLPRSSGLYLAVRTVDPSVEHVVTSRERWYLSGLDLDTA